MLGPHDNNALLDHLPLGSGTSRRHLRPNLCRRLRRNRFKVTGSHLNVVPALPWPPPINWNENKPDQLHRLGESQPMTLLFLVNQPKVEIAQGVVLIEVDPGLTLSLPTAVAEAMCRAIVGNAPAVRRRSPPEGSPTDVGMLRPHDIDALFHDLPLGSGADRCDTPVRLHVPRER